jgi:colanic acid/amylovoran biosynthesis glycosyltransferase
MGSVFTARCPLTNGKVAYIMSRFPHLPETFILREMIEMENLGWEICLYPLVLQEQSVTHPAVKKFEQRAHSLPFISGPILSANLSALFHHPGLYFRLLGTIIKENSSSAKFLVRALAVFPKCVLMARMMQKEGIQHIHAHYATHPALAAWIINQLTSIPYSVTAHAHDIYVEKPMLGTKLRNSAFVVAISEFNKKYLIDYLGEWIRSKIHVIHCGVQLEDYENRSENPSDKIFQILNIGSLQPYKGQKYLIYACAKLIQDGIPIHCSIIGGGELFTELSAQINLLGLESTVELMGARTQDEIAKLLPKADCYVQPSIVTANGKMEGIPVSLMEAMACSVPVIATSISGVPELVQDQVTGLLVPPDNVDALVLAIKSIYKDTLSRKRMTKRGRELVKQQFSLSKNVIELSELLKTSLETL